jgi:hypothetical protein
MFNGYNWQTRVLEVRPDRLPPEMDGLNGTTPPMSSGIQNPMMPYGSAMTPIQGSFPSEDPMNMLSRPASSGLGKTLFVGNVRHPECCSVDSSLTCHSSRFTVSGRI